MATVETIIVGAGIKAQAPFTVGQFPVVVQSDPATVSDGNIRQDGSTPPKVYVGESGYAVGVTVLGGAVSKAAGTNQHIVIGSGATALPTLETRASVVIGKNAVNGLSTGNIVIGDGADATGSGAAGGLSVLIGVDCKINNPAAGQGCVAIGNGVTIALGSQHVAIGGSVSITANNGITVVGSGSSVSGGAGVSNVTLIGQGHTTNSTRNIAVGTGCNFTGFSNSIVLGISVAVDANNTVYLCNNDPTGYTQVVIGKGSTSTSPQAITIRGTNALNANVAAAAVTLAAGRSTGNAASAPVNIDVGVVGAAGAALQVQQTGVRVSYSATADDTYLMLFDVNSGTIKRVVVGAVDSGGAGFRLLRVVN